LRNQRAQVINALEAWEIEEIFAAMPPSRIALRDRNAFTVGKPFAVNSICGRVTLRAQIARRNRH
jgi:hypothetical protein